jgi:ribonucleoside-triphosphate reductase
METLVNAMCDSGMGYFAINHPVDRDPVCGYVGYFPNGVCPRCGRKEGEGVSVSKLLSLRSYSPDPEYDARREISSANVTLNLVK